MSIAKYGLTIARRGDSWSNLTTSRRCQAASGGTDSLPSYRYAAAAHLQYFNFHCEFQSLLIDVSSQRVTVHWVIWPAKFVGRVLIKFNGRQLRTFEVPGARPGPAPLLLQIMFDSRKLQHSRKSVDSKTFLMKRR